MRDSVIFITGQAGTCKRELAQKLATHLAQKKSLPRDLQNEHTRRLVQVHQVEDHIPDLAGFLDNYNAKWRQDTWNEAVEAIHQNLQAQPPQFTFLLFHYSYFRNGRLFSQVNWDRLSLFRPRSVVTLIDDVHDIWERIRAREETFKTRSAMSLDSILLWRSVEIAGSRQLAHNLYVNPKVYNINASAEQFKSMPFLGSEIEHHVVAVKHPVETFYRLLFEPDRLRIYASFPISKPRGNPRDREEIDLARGRLVSEFTVFDPLTIDEYRTDSDTAWQAAVRDFSRFPERWPIPDAPPLGPPAIKTTTPTKSPLARWDLERKKHIALTAAEVRNLRLTVFGQVVDRDFQLVRQAQHLAVYRPFFGARPTPSGGVGDEMVFSGNYHVPLAMLHPPADYNSEQKQLFRTLGSWSGFTQFPGVDKKLRKNSQPLEQLEELIDHLRKYQQKRVLEP